MIYKIKRLLASNKFESMQTIFNIVLLVVAIINIFYHVNIGIKLNIQLSFIIIVLCLIGMLLSIKAHKLKIRKASYEFAIDAEFLRLLKLANELKNKPNMTIQLWIALQSYKINAYFVSACQESLLSYEEYVFIMKCLDSIPNIIKGADE